MTNLDDFEQGLRRDADTLLERLLTEQARVVTRRRRVRACVAGVAVVGAGLLLATLLHDRSAQPGRSSPDAPTVAHDSTPEVPCSIPRIEIVDRAERRVALEYLSDMETRAELAAGGFDLDLVEVDGTMMLVGRE
jgi:hypothetical protein